MIDASALRLLLEQAAGRPLAELSDEATLADGLGFDSLALLELALGLEERFGIAVSAQDVADAFRTVGSLRALIEARARGGP
jgi:acyl carrier protein